MNIKKCLFLIFCLVIALGLGGCRRVYVQDGDHRLIIQSSEVAEVEDVRELISRAKNIENLYYEFFKVEQGNGQVSSGKYWQKNENIRIEKEKNNKKTVFIFDQDNNIFYVYNPEENKADKMLISSGSQADQLAADITAELGKYDLEKAGKEVVDNKNCLLVQYRAGTYLNKVWLWQKYGLPLKFEAETAEGKIITTFLNFDFKKVEDTMFKIPQAVEINDMTLPR